MLDRHLNKAAGLLAAAVLALLATFAGAGEGEGEDAGSAHRRDPGGGATPSDDRT
ncbi:hypothetical protein [Streptomyces klenkii]|uniref:hypothetical protein n=1 Tax=Streptomyces klenkii TaxID=1420899 RepID=UPI001319D61F|nr:hypothetical protein [Streptomyces klenkii]